MTGWELFPIVIIILLAGILGGIVNTALGWKEEELAINPEEKDAPATNAKNKDESAPNPAGRNVIIGIGAAFLVPLFLKSVDSKILDTLPIPPMSCLLLFSYCTLAAISARHFITTLTEQVFRKIDTLTKETEANKQELDKTKQGLEKAKGASLSAKNVALAATDAARLQTIELVQTAPVRTKPATLHLSSDEYDKALKQDDPWKGRFGSLAQQNGRKLEARLDPIEGQPGLGVITLTVAPTDSTKPLTGKVQFFLHPTYKNYLPEMPVQDGKATLRLMSYGAFTVGVVCDEGATMLELDLSEIPGAWEPWKSL